MGNSGRLQFVYNNSDFLVDKCRESSYNYYMF